MEEITKDKEITFRDIFGKKIKKVYCIYCNEEISTITHLKNKDGFICISCAVKRGLIKV